MADPTTAAAGAAEQAAKEAEPVDPMVRIVALADMMEKAMEKSAAAGAAALADLASPVATPTVSLLSRLTPRMLLCLVLAVGLAAMLAVVSPQQLPVAGYKLALVTMAAYLGYWIDRWGFPYARPDSFLVAADWRTDAKAAQDQANHPVVAGCERIYAFAMVRRALIMLGTMLAMGLGL